MTSCTGCGGVARIWTTVPAVSATIFSCGWQIPPVYCPHFNEKRPSWSFISVGWSCAPLKGDPESIKSGGLNKRPIGCLPSRLPTPHSHFHYNTACITKCSHFTGLLIETHFFLFCPESAVNGPGWLISGAIVYIHVHIKYKNRKKICVTFKN